MRVCGIDITSGTANLVVVEWVNGEVCLVPSSPRKLAIGDSSSSRDLKSLKSTIDAFVRDNQIAQIAIRARAEKGTYAGSAAGFKIEGLIQVAPVESVELIHPTTIAAFRRKTSIDLPSELKQYQHDAYFTAVTYLHSKMETPRGS